MRATSTRRLLAVWPAAPRRTASIIDLSYSGGTGRGSPGASLYSPTASFLEVVCQIESTARRLVQTLTLDHNASRGTTSASVYHTGGTAKGCAAAASTCSVGGTTCGRGPVTTFPGAGRPPFLIGKGLIILTGAAEESCGDDQRSVYSDSRVGHGIPHQRMAVLFE